MTMEAETQTAARKAFPRRPWFLRQVNGTVGAALLAVVLLGALMGYVWVRYDPVEPDFLKRFEAPSWTHPMGTDQWGRDVFSRILAGARASVTVALATVVLAVSVGTIVGGLSGYFGGWADRLVMLLTDALLAFPGLLLALAVMAVAGPSQTGVIIALGLSYARRSCDWCAVPFCRCASESSSRHRARSATRRCTPCFAMCCPIAPRR